MIKLLRALWERLSLYLPVILMGVLALGTYWLVRSTPLLLTTAQEQPPKHESDYFMRNFSVRTFDESGRLKSEVFGANARHFPDTDTLDVDFVRIRSFSVEGRLTTATASRAVVNGDASEVQLIGNARVVRESGVDGAGQSFQRMEFRSEFLHVSVPAERLESDKQVELMRGEDRFTADKLDFNNADRVLQLKGRVKGRLVPDASK
ncbi:MAG: LPS export ABC transporter periplasmic protein LptC [Comamonadaceae bacterium]